MTYRLVQTTTTLCPMCGNWETVNQAIREALNGVSLADMTPAVPSFMDRPEEAPQAVSKSAVSVS